MIVILYCQTRKVEQVQRILNRYGVHSYIPKMEKYIASQEKVVQDIIMFPGYLFVDTKMSQEEFSSFLETLEDKSGIIKTLTNTDTTALQEEEQQLFDILFDENWVLKISHGYRDGHITRITKGPLLSLESWISKVNKKEGVAYLDFTFLNRPIKVGILIDQEEEVKITQS